MIVLLSSVAGTIVKPEIFSLVLFHVVVWAYCEARRSGRAIWLYLVPLLVLIWVNVHGGFILAVPFLLATLCGEALNRRFAFHLPIAWALCGVSVLINPYGWRYPWQLFQDYVLA